MLQSKQLENCTENKNGFVALKFLFYFTEVFFPVFFLHFDSYISKGDKRFYFQNRRFYFLSSVNGSILKTIIKAKLAKL